MSARALSTTTGVSTTCLLAAALGCADVAEPDPRVGEPALQLSAALPTVVLAEWQDEADTARLTWTTDGASWQSTPARRTDEGTWAATAFGLRPSEHYDFKVEARFDGERADGAARGLSTGPVPDDVVELEVLEDHDNGGFLALGVLGPNPMALILDGHGNPVWWWAIPDPTLLVTRVLRSVDERTVLVSAMKSIDASVTEGLAIYRVAYDGTLVESIPAEEGHHDFTELPDGTLAWLGHDTRRDGVREVRGDVIFERAPGGEVREVWNTFDWFEWKSDEWHDEVSVLHANALRYDPTTDRYWMSARNLDQLLVIDRSSGEIAERIFGDDSDFRVGRGGPTDGQHSFSLLDDGNFVILDNRGTTDHISRAIEYHVDRRHRRVDQVWHYRSDERLHVSGLGDVARLPDGDTIIVWSSAGEIQRVRPRGSTVWRANTPLGFALGYLQWTASPEVLPL